MRKADIQVGKTYAKYHHVSRKHHSLTRTVVAEGDERIRYRDDKGLERACTRAAFARWAQREVVNG